MFLLWTILVVPEVISLVLIMSGITIPQSSANSHVSCKRGNNQDVSRVVACCTSSGRHSARQHTTDLQLAFSMENLLGCSTWCNLGRSSDGDNHGTCDPCGGSSLLLVENMYRKMIISTMYIPPWSRMSHSQNMSKLTPHYSPFSPVVTSVRIDWVQSTKSTSGKPSAVCAIGQDLVANYRKSCRRHMSGMQCACLIPRRRRFDHGRSGTTNQNKRLIRIKRSTKSFLGSLPTSTSSSIVLFADHVQILAADLNHCWWRNHANLQNNTCWISKISVRRPEFWPGETPSIWRHDFYVNNCCWLELLRPLLMSPTVTSAGSRTTQFFPSKFRPIDCDFWRVHSRTSGSQRHLFGRIASIRWVCPMVPPSHWWFPMY